MNHRTSCDGSAGVHKALPLLLSYVPCCRIERISKFSSREESGDAKSARRGARHTLRRALNMALHALMLSMGALLCTSAYAISVHSSLKSTHHDAFDTWSVRHGKKYSVADELRARKVWAENDAIISAHNARDPPPSYTLGHNQFSDLTVAEYSKMMLGTRPNLKRNATWPPRRPAAPASSEAMDDSVDWIERGAVTGVKNQGQCGGCWAFATTGAVEGAYAIATGSLVSLSEEQILACDSSEEGCGGGNPEQALDWIHQNGGICSESSWPYDSSGGDVDTCSTSCTNVVTVGGYEAVPEGDEDALVDALRLAPVAVAIEADTTNFQLYQSGVYDNPDCFSKGQVDHGVLLVGFGNDDTGTPFYKLKNSWGTTWGESGYMRLARGGNICGVASEPTYATSAAAAGGGGGPTPPAPTPRPAPPGGCRGEYCPYIPDGCYVSSGTSSSGTMRITVSSMGTELDVTMTIDRCASPNQTHSPCCSLRHTHLSHTIMRSIPSKSAAASTRGMTSSPTPKMDMWTTSHRRGSSITTMNAQQPRAARRIGLASTLWRTGASRSVAKRGVRQRVRHCPLPRHLVGSRARYLGSRSQSLPPWLQVAFWQWHSCSSVCVSSARATGKQTRRGG